jgi:hypothetical protein
MTTVPMSGMLLPASLPGITTLRRPPILTPPGVGARSHGERPRISTGCAPSCPAACRILRERGRYRTARLVARSHDARRRLLLIFVGHPCDVGLSWIEAAPSLQELSRPARLSRLRDQLRATSVPSVRHSFQALPHTSMSCSIRILPDHSFGSRSKRASRLFQRCV